MSGAQPGRAPARGPFGGPMGRGAAPIEKARSFGPSARRLLGTLRPERAGLIAVVLFGILSVGLTVLGPKLLGDGTNIVFAGFISLQFPAGTSEQQVVDSLVAAGQQEQADMISAMSFTPGAGVDFAALGAILLMVLTVYVLGSMFAWLQARLLNGIVQRAMHRLRMQVEHKVHRLSLIHI